MITIPYIWSNKNKETIELYVKCMRMVLGFNDETYIYHYAGPFIDSRNNDFVKVALERENRTPQIQVNSALQLLDYWQNKPNFKFTKYKIYADYFLPVISELDGLNEFKINDREFKVEKNLDNFLISERKWINFYSLFFLSKEQIHTLVVNGKTNIFYGEEAYNRCFQSMEKFFIELGISKDTIRENITWSGGLVMGYEKATVGKYISFPMTMIHPTYFVGNEDYFSDIMHHFPLEKKYDLLYLVRKKRQHRIFPILFLEKLTGLENHLITHPKFMEDSRYNYTSLRIDNSENQPFKIFLGDNENILNRFSNYNINKEITLPLKSEYCSKEELDYLSWSTMIEPDKNNFINSKLSLVAETTFFDWELNATDNFKTNQIFLSEKTGRCLLYGHPFIILTNVDAINALKNLGFRTFDGLFEESYAEIPNDYDRLEYATIKSVEVIKNWSNLDKLKLKDILIHNHNHFKGDFYNTLLKNTYEF